MFRKARTRFWIEVALAEAGAIAIDPYGTSIIYIRTTGRVTPQAKAGLKGSASCIRVGSSYLSWNTGDATQFFNQAINVISVDPANSQRLYLISSNGVFRSTNGGQNWIPGVDSNGEARSLVLDTSSRAGARILYMGA